MPPPLEEAMAYEHKPGKGSVFNNQYKESDRQPDMKGSMKTPDGKDWEVSGWWNEGRNGDYLALSIQEPYDPTGGRGGASGAGAAGSARRGPSGGRDGGRPGSGPRGPSGGRESVDFEEQRRRMREAGERARKSMGIEVDDDEITF